MPNDKEKPLENKDETVGNPTTAPQEDKHEALVARVEKLEADTAATMRATGLHGLEHLKKPGD